MSHLNWAIKKTFANFYCSKVPSQFDIYDMDQNLLVFDSSNETEFSRHIIIPGFHVQNHHEAKAFADEVVKNLDARFCLAVDLGVYKSLQNFCLYMNHKLGSNRVKELLVSSRPPVTCSLHISLMAVLNSLLFWADMQSRKPLRLTLS